jgi:hypothetical protein
MKQIMRKLPESMTRWRMAGRKRVRPAPCMKQGRSRNRIEAETYHHKKNNGVERPDGLKYKEEQHEFSREFPMGRRYRSQSM